MNDDESTVTIRRSTFERMMAELICFRDVIQADVDESNDIGEVMELDSRARQVAALLREAGLSD